jgi:hypothetical protein
MAGQSQSPNGSLAFTSTLPYMKVKPRADLLEKKGHGQSSYTVSDPALQVSTALKDSALCDPAFQDSVLSCITRLCAI